MMIEMLGFYICVSLVVALPFLARYVIVSVREHFRQNGKMLFEQTMDQAHFPGKFLQKF